MRGGAGHETGEKVGRGAANVASYPGSFSRGRENEPGDEARERGGAVLAILDPGGVVYNHWTGLVDWTGGLDWWTGLVD